MRIWLITVGEPLPLPGSNARPWRTGILAELLRRRGHRVIWWTSTLDHFSKQLQAARNQRSSVAEGLELQFLHGRPYQRNVSLARLLNHWQLGREFRRLSARETSPDVILVSYPTIELSDEAVRYATPRGIPVLVDVRDLWPDEMAARLLPAFRPLAGLLLAPLYARARRALRNASGIVGISQTYLQWARALAGRGERAGDLWAPLGYRAADPGAPLSRKAEEKLLASGVRPSRKIVWFCGTFVGSIDLRTAIEAARLLEPETHFQFVFTGSGERDAEWRGLAAALSNVVFTGWVGQDELAWLSKHAWVGLAPYKPKALMSLPNKLFEYMSAALPIVSSLRGEAQALIRAHDIGVTFEAGDASDLAERLRALWKRPADVERHSANARAVFDEQFDAALVYERLANHLENSALGRRSSAGFVAAANAASRAA